ncbi:anti-sigma-factor antagonist [Thioalkalivibrio nitratireducens DSM 14787]|uniref:Anti-sigma-factor antagonist n=1 Tax=Thioalkalivibrio nitratireducens (strain DSM 14787 / UNIQEM 213 / ALEN2) TaxID=1255043 RepID=L0E0U1_THIND|nr:anti-sigma-factor antagonist [Thioalkalivibrio nitratireducens DSM 14787]
MLEGATLRFSGPLTFATAPALMARGEELLPRLPPSAALDLSGATRVDSAGIALLVEFWRQRERAGARLVWTAVPEDLRPLLVLYRLEELLGPDPAV